MEDSMKDLRNIKARLDVNVMYRGKYEDLTRKFFLENERLLEEVFDLKRQIRDLESSIEHKNHLLEENEIMNMINVEEK